MPKAVVQIAGTRSFPGTVRIGKLFADGGHNIAEFCFAGDCFGIDNENERIYSAEAVDDVIVMRYGRGATEQLVDHNPAVARLLREVMLRDLATAHGRTLLLGRIAAPERVAAFLLSSAATRRAFSTCRWRATTLPTTLA